MVVGLEPAHYSMCYLPMASHGVTSYLRFSDIELSHDLFSNVQEPFNNS